MLMYRYYGAENERIQKDVPRGVQRLLLRTVTVLPGHSTFMLQIVKLLPHVHLTNRQRCQPRRRTEIAP